MKCCTLVLFFVFLLSLTSSAQNNTTFRKFKVITAIGYANGISALGVGVSLSAEPAYTITNHITTGIRFETASVRHLYDFDQFVSSDFGSIVATFNYYLNNVKLRWFFGGGMGLYALVSDERLINQEDENKVGFMARVGFDLRHFHMALEGNVTGKSQYDAANNYFSLKFGVNIGGGIKK